MTRHCHRCGWEWTFRELPGRSETCPECRADLRACINCAFFDRRAANQCRDGRAEPVEEKEQANFCEFFDFAQRAWAAPSGDDREADARARFRSLFGE